MKMDICIDDVRYTITNTDMLRNYIDPIGGASVQYGVDEMQIVPAHLYNPHQKEDRYYILGPPPSGEDYILYSQSFPWKDVVNKIRKMKYKQWKEHVHVSPDIPEIKELLRRKYKK